MPTILTSGRDCAIVHQVSSYRNQGRLIVNFSKRAFCVTVVKFVLVVVPDLCLLSFSFLVNESLQNIQTIRQFVFGDVDKKNTTD